MEISRQAEASAAAERWARSGVLCAAALVLESGKGVKAVLRAPKKRHLLSYKT